MIYDKLNDLCNTKLNQIIDWFEHKYSKTKPMIYSSVDIRNSGYKIAPVDTNLFPAGFNNLNQDAFELASVYFRDYINKHYPNIKKILVITENHTRNLHYLDNLLVICKIIEKSGFFAELANFDIVENIELVSASGVQLVIKKIDKIDKNIDLILLNNDLTSNVSKILIESDKPIIPSIKFGWHSRTKSNHFDRYNETAQSFCKEFLIDPFFITTLHYNHKIKDLKNGQDLFTLASKIDQMLSFLKCKYQSYGIKDDPYIFIKSDMGTYGMGIINVKSGDEVININKNSRKKLSVIKSGIKNDTFILQEGIKTIDQINGFSAESMVYCVKGKAVADIKRYNTEKDQYHNLNSNGMKFFCFDKSIFNANYLIAQLASLAACFEF